LPFALLWLAGCGDGARSRAAYPTPAPEASSAAAVAKATAPIDMALPDAGLVAAVADAGAPAPPERETNAPAPPVVVDAGPTVDPNNPTACAEQPPQDFLIRTNYMPKPGASREDIKRGQAGHQEAIKYRTEHYGYVRGFGKPEMNAHPPGFYTETIKWWGLSVVVHKKIVPALQCIEQEIKRVCTEKPYTPHALGGIRFNNTYHTGEITNHMFGIAMDIDPAINSCCGCVPPWNNNPLCHKAVKSEYDRMSMPECWVHQFERFGFYWLGHDPMRDTMHYEFLGDPDKILKDPKVASP
jgi:hypothetical protein